MTQPMLVTENEAVEVNYSRSSRGRTEAVFEEVAYPVAGLDEGGWRDEDLRDQAASEEVRRVHWVRRGFEVRCHLTWADVGIRGIWDLS